MSGEALEKVLGGLEGLVPQEAPGGRGFSLGHPETLGFGSDAFVQDAWLAQDGDALLGGDSYGTIGNGAGDKGAVGAITTGEGMLAESQIGQMIQAMATYSCGHAGVDLAAARMDDSALQATLVAVWHKVG